MGNSAVPHAEHTGPADFDTWLNELEVEGEARGYYEPIGDHHSVVFSDEGTTLLVTFERAEDIRTGAGAGQPLGWRLSEGEDWSSLCLIAHRDSWFRSPYMYGYFDRLVDDGFFEDFDRVVFYGAEMCGYAAAAFSVVAPGAELILISPQATLDPAHADWDIRFPAMRRTSFTDRYGYAPDMCENAGQVFVIFDPNNREDAMHAALFNSDNIRPFPIKDLSADIELELINMEVLPPLIQAAVNGNLTTDLLMQLTMSGKRGYHLRRGFQKVADAVKGTNRRRILIDLTP